MNVINQDLILTRDELIEMINHDNTDRNDWSREKLIKMINTYKIFSKKQYEWILSKVRYITNHNSKYRKFRKTFKNFEIERI